MSQTRAAAARRRANLDAAGALGRSGLASLDGLTGRRFGGPICPAPQRRGGHRYPDLSTTTAPVYLVSNTPALHRQGRRVSQRLADSEQTFLKLLHTKRKNQNQLSRWIPTSSPSRIVIDEGVEQQLYSNSCCRTL